MQTINDYRIAAAVGFFTGLFFLPVLYNLSATLPFGLPRVSVLIIIPILWMAGIWLGRVLSRWFGIMALFSRYVASGFLSFSIDFGILNLLIFLTGHTAGIAFALFKGTSYMVANVNAYIWNKYWVFRIYENGEQISFYSVIREYGRFFIVSIIGFIINVSIASFMVDAIKPQFGFDPKMWANVAAVAATAIAIIWNFAGYKLFVFRKQGEQSVD